MKFSLGVLGAFGEARRLTAERRLVPPAASSGSGPTLVPLETGVGGIALRATRVVALGAIFAAAALLLAAMLTGVLVEDDLLDDSGEFRSLLLGPAAAMSIPLAAAGFLGQALVHDARARGLLRAAEARATGPRSSAPGAPIPPAIERLQIGIGPHPARWGTGLVVAGVGALVAVCGAALAPQIGSHGVGLGALAAGVVVLALGLGLAIPARPDGAARRDWAARRAPLESRWRHRTLLDLRYRRPQRIPGRGLAVFGLVVGTLMFVVALLMRKPGRHAPRRQWDDAGERVIDMLFSAGSVTIVACAAVLLALGVAGLVREAAVQRRAVLALERGEEVDAAEVDAILLDASAGERAAMAFAALGWLAVAFGTAMVLDDVQPEMGVLALAASAGAIPAAWLIGFVAARAGQARRTRVAALSGRDPLPVSDPKQLALLDAEPGS